MLLHSSIFLIVPCEGEQRAGTESEGNCKKMFRRRSSSDLKLVPLGDRGDLWGSFDPVLANLLPSGCGSDDSDVSLSKVPSLSSSVRMDSGDLIDRDLKQQQQQQQQNGLAMLLQQDETQALHRRRSSSTQSWPPPSQYHQLPMGQAGEHPCFALHLQRRTSSNDSLAVAVRAALRSHSGTSCGAQSPTVAGAAAAATTATAAPYSLKAETDSVPYSKAETVCLFSSQ